jgi:hypothetical protein
VLLSDVDDVLTAAESLGGALAEAKSERDRDDFEALLEDCTETITEVTGVDYADACHAGSDCC